MAYELTIDGQAVTADILARNPNLQVAVAGASHEVIGAGLSQATEFEFYVDGHIFRGWRYATGQEVHIRLEGRTFVVALPQFGGGAGGGGAHENEIHADMPGTVVAVHCAVGDAVTSGQKLLTIESMKLQISMVAPRDGTVEKLPVAANATFERGALLAALKPAQA